MTRGRSVRDMSNEDEKEPAYPAWRRFWWGVKYLFWSAEEILAEEKRNMNRVIMNQQYDIKQAVRESEWTMADARKCVKDHNMEAATQHLHAYAQQLVGLARMRDRANRLSQLKITLGVTMSQVQMMKIHESMAFALDKWSDKDSLDSRLLVMDKMEEDLAETRELLDAADMRLEQHAHATETTAAAVYVNKPIDDTVKNLLTQLQEDDIKALERQLPDVGKRIRKKQIPVRY